MTGSRNWTDYFAVWDALDDLYATIAEDEMFIVVHGGADGADELADEWVEMKRAAWRRMRKRKRCPVDREVHRPDYERYPPRVAPQKRNEVMIAAGADRCLAYLMPCERSGCRRTKPHATHGGGRTAKLARNAGIPTVHFGADDLP